MKKLKVEFSVMDIGATINGRLTLEVPDYVRIDGGSTVEDDDIVIQAIWQRLQDVVNDGGDNIYIDDWKEA